MARKDRCLDCAWCAEGPGPEGEPCFECRRSERILPAELVWRRACRDFAPLSGGGDPPRPPVLLER